MEDNQNKKIDFELTGEEFNKYSKTEKYPPTTSPLIPSDNLSKINSENMNYEGNSESKYLKIIHIFIS